MSAANMTTVVYQNWTEEGLVMLEAAYWFGGRKGIAAIFPDRCINRSVSTCHKKGFRKGPLFAFASRSKPVSVIKWSKEEDDYMRRNYTKNGVFACVRGLKDKSQYAVNMRALILGLQKRVINAAIKKQDDLAVIRVSNLKPSDVKKAVPSSVFELAEYI